MFLFHIYIIELEIQYLMQNDLWHRLYKVLNIRIIFLQMNTVNEIYIYVCHVAKNMTGLTYIYDKAPWTLNQAYISKIYSKFGTLIEIS